MKCKAFNINYHSSHELDINEWLKNQKNISIDHVTTVQIQDKFGFLYIFYSDRKDKLEQLNSYEDNK